MTYWSVAIFAITQIIFCTELSAAKDLPAIINEEQSLERDFEQHNLDIDLNRLDQLAIDKMDFIAEVLLQAVSAKIEAEGYRQNLEPLLRSQTHLFNLYEKYTIEKGRFGQSKDHLRTAAYRKFLAFGFELYQELSGSAPVQKTISPSKARLVSSLLRHFPMVLPFIFSDELRRSHAGFSRVLRVVSDIGSAYFPLGIQWIGEEQLEFLKNDRSREKVNLVVMNHSEVLYDKFIMAGVLGELPGSSAIIALAQGWQNGLVAKLAMRNQSIISVGDRDGKKYGETATRVLAALDGGVRNLFLFPEGSTGAGFGELKPVAEGFVKRLLPTLLEKYSVRVLVVTSLDTYRLLGHLKLDGPARIVLGPLIQDDELRSKIAKDPKDFENLLRKIWALNLENSSTKLFGQFRIAELMRFLQEDIGISRSSQSCKGLFANFD